MDNPVTAAIQALKGMVGNATKPEQQEPGPGDVGPSIETKKDQTPGSLVTLKMTPDECAEWWERIKRARERRSARETLWDILLKEYLPIISKSGEAETVKVQQHFRNVHSKIGQLFYRSPDLIMTPRDPSPLNNQIPNPMNAGRPPDQQLPPLTMEDIVSVKQAVLQSKLGRDGIKANRLMDELLFDVLAWSGIGCSKLGYRCVFRKIEEPALGPDPNFNPQANPNVPGATGATTLGLNVPTPQAPTVPLTNADGTPQMQSIPVPVYEEW